MSSIGMCRLRDCLVAAVFALTLPSIALADSICLQVLDAAGTGISIQCQVPFDPNDPTAVYAAVFGWGVRTRGDGALAFDDTTGEVSGSFVTGRPPSPDPGLLVYIMVDSVAEAVEAVIARGGDIVQPIGSDAPEITARFRDPGGNVIGLYQEPDAPAP